MNKVKIALSAVAAIAAVGGAFAFKKAKVASPFVYHYDTSPTSGLNCTLEAAGYLYSTPRSGSPYVFIDTDGDAACETGGYILLNAN